MSYLNIDEIIHKPSIFAKFFVHFVFSFFYFLEVYCYRSSVLSDQFCKLISLQSPKQSEVKAKQIVCWLPLVFLPYNKWVAILVVFYSSVFLFSFIFCFTGSQPENSLINLCGMERVFSVNAVKSD